MSTRVVRDRPKKNFWRFLKPSKSTDSVKLPKTLTMHPNTPIKPPRRTFLDALKPRRNSTDTAASSTETTAKPAKRTFLDALKSRRSSTDSTAFTSDNDSTSKPRKRAFLSALKPRRSSTDSTSKPKRKLFSALVPHRNLSSSTIRSDVSSVLRVKIGDSPYWVTWPPKRDFSATLIKYRRLRPLKRRSAIPDPLYIIAPTLTTYPLGQGWRTFAVRPPCDYPPPPEPWTFDPSSLRSYNSTRDAFNDDHGPAGPYALTSMFGIEMLHERFVLEDFLFRFCRPHPFVEPGAFGVKEGEWERRERHMSNDGECRREIMFGDAALSRVLSRDIL